MDTEPEGDRAATRSDALPPWRENRASRGLFGRASLRELWAYRELVGFLALRDLKVRYAQAAFGVAWALVQPIAAAAALTLVFDHVADVPSQGIAYPVFAFAGTVVWTYASGAVSAASDSLVGNPALVSKVYVPRIAAPLAAVLPGLADLAVGLVVLAPLALAAGLRPTPALLALPLVVVGAAAAALGVGLWLAALNVRYRDVRHATPLLLQLWLFLSPVGYPLDALSGAARTAAALNPLAGAVSAFRWSVLGTPLPLRDVLPSALVALALLLGGAAFFARAERDFADVL